MKAYVLALKAPSPSVGGFAQLGNAEINELDHNGSEGRVFRPPTVGNADGEGRHEACPYVLGKRPRVVGAHEGRPYVVGIRQENVIGFEVAMNDAELVRGVQSSRGLLENFRNLRHRKRARRVRAWRRDSPSRNSMAM